MKLESLPVNYQVCIHYVDFEGNSYMWRVDNRIADNCIEKLEREGYRLIRKAY